jgi:protocatechuate 3,4-dioxygenase beta subunit
LSESAIGTRLSGEVELYEDSAKEAFRRVGGVPSVSVRVSGPEGSTFQTETNADGAYEVYSLRPGRYTVRVTVPKGFRIAFPVITGSLSSRNRTSADLVSRDEAAVELAKNGGVGVGFVLKADTRLSGRLLDGKGDPITGVCIDLEPLEGRGEGGARFFDCSKAGGVFQMEMMPPGKYWLAARDEIKVNRHVSRSTLYYPGVRDRDAAKIVSIEPGKYVEHLDIRLPSHEKRYKFTGRMQFEDGAPADGATVTFTSSRHGYSETSETAADGSFDLLVVAGMEGQLDGEMSILAPILKSCPTFKVGPRIRGMLRFVDASSILLSSDSDRRDLELVLPSPSCKAWLLDRN